MRQYELNAIRNANLKSNKTVSNYETKTMNRKRVFNKKTQSRTEQRKRMNLQINEIGIAVVD